MADFTVRAIEVHSIYAWDFRWMMKVLEYAERHGLNAIVLHRNDAVEQVVYPGVLFGAKEGECSTIFERYRTGFRKIYRYTPTRRSGPLLRREYLKRLTAVAKRRGIAVYLENKELSFPDVLLELTPELQKDGHYCPTEPFWWDFIRIKYEELFQDIPDIAGIITSVGTGESRVSITSNRCTCERCRSTTPEQWYRRVLDVMHTVLAARGKRLIVRDFVFTRKAHDELASGFESLPSDVAVAIKDTPHDYYPTFPQNPLIGKLGTREKWIEYDMMGQYFGWGIGPSTLVEYMKDRIASAHARGAAGIILRTDWESLDGHTAFDTPNSVQLLAGALYGNSVATRPETVVRTWLEESRAFRNGSDGVEKEKVTALMMPIFRENWEIVRRALFIRDCVFNDCSTFPVGFAQAEWLAEEKNSLADWVPEKSGALAATEENTRRILEEKNEAWNRVTALERQVRGMAGNFEPGFARDLTGRYEVFSLYVRGFAAAGKLFALVRCAGNPGCAESGSGLPVRPLFEETVRETDKVIELYGGFYARTEYPAAVYQLLSAERLRSFRDDCVATFERRTAETTPEGAPE